MRFVFGCLAVGLAVGLAGLIAFSYGGKWHPAGDSFAVFRLWLAAALAGVSTIVYALGLRLTGFLGAFGAALAAMPILLMFAHTGQRLGTDFASDLAVYSKNTLGGQGDDDAIVADILATGADVVLLQEMNRSRSDFELALSDTHPYSHVCRFSDWSGIGVVSRWPIEDTYCSPHRSFAAAYVLGPDGPFWAISTHLVWPFPFGQREYLEQALPFLESVEGRTIVGGDFNMVPWSASVSEVAQATNTQRLGPLRTTLRVRRVPLQIDHMLSTGDGEVSLRPLLGTDHHGVFARIRWAGG